METLDAAQTIRSLRQQQNITQVDLAKLSGASLPTIQNIEAGKGNPTLDVLQKILSALNATLSIESAMPRWDLLASLGVPILQTQDFIVLEKSEARLLKELRPALSLSLQQLSDRERDALYATYLALQTHFPETFKRLHLKSARMTQLSKATDPARILKLRRIAIRNLSEYL